MARAIIQPPDVAPVLDPPRLLRAEDGSFFPRGIVAIWDSKHRVVHYHRDIFPMLHRHEQTAIIFMDKPFMEEPVDFNSRLYDALTS